MGEADPMIARSIRPCNGIVEADVKTTRSVFPRSPDEWEHFPKIARRSFHFPKTARQGEESEFKMSYMPGGLLPFQSWANNFLTIITATPANYGIVAGDITAVQTAYDLFDGDLTGSTAPETRTPVTVAATQASFANCRLLCQGLVDMIQASGVPTGAALTAAGLTDRKNTKTPIGPPTATPDVSIQRITPQSMVIRLKELGAILNALPAGSVGYQVAMKINPTIPPASPSELEILGTGSRRFFQIDFPPTAIGSPVFVALRYRNAKSELGPWSSIVSSTVVSG